MFAWRKTALWDRLLLPPSKPRPMGLIAVQMSINPFEMYWLIGICIIGVLYIFGLQAPSSVAILLPGWAVKLWAVNLGIGGIIGLAGGLWRRKLLTGLALYQFGWGQIGLGTLIYGLALLISFGSTALMPGLSNLLWALACFTRVLQVQRFLQRAEHFRKQEAAQLSGGQS
jgi:hypothetical protein